MRETNEVTLEKAKEILERFGAETPTATNFMPEFMDDVEVLGPGAPPVPVNPNYCLSIVSALRLMVVLEDLGPVAYLDPPQVFASGSPFQYSREVPWMTFNNGAVRNAGLLAIYWNTYHGDPSGKYADANARADIAWG
jgi:hypothetical protein